MHINKIINLFRQKISASTICSQLNFLHDLDSEEPRELPPAEKRIFVFWTGENSMSKARASCLDNIRKLSGVPVILITPENLKDFIVQQHPLPQEFNHLSLVHKSDYLRSYFMYHHGGGYCDIKSIRHSWINAFDKLNNERYKSGLGYQELKKGVGLIRNDNEYPQKNVATVNSSMQNYYYNLIGNCAYIFKPKSLIFERLLLEQERRLKLHSEELIRHPGNILGDNPGYPLRWTYILGQIFHPIVFIRKDDLIQDNSIMPIFKNYR